MRLVDSDRFDGGAIAFTLQIKKIMACVCEPESLV
jgi:hypothetical protein